MGDNEKPAYRVCHMTTAHPFPDVRIFCKECITLAGAGYNVSLLVQREHGKQEIINGIEIVPLPKASGRIHRMLALPWRAFMAALRQKADLYHFHDPELLPVGVLLSLLTHGRVIYDAHESYSKQMLYKTYMPVPFRKFFSFATMAAERVASFFISGAVAATGDIKAELTFFKNCVSVRNYPVKKSFPNVKREEQAGADSNVFRVVYSGTMSAERGVGQAVRSLEYCRAGRQLRLVLCGRFDAGYENQIKALKGFESVDNIGFLAPDKVPVILDTCDAGIVCLLPEKNYLRSLPVKLFEYMAAGLPVIASNFPLWREIVEGNGCGICVDPLKPEEIAHAIDRLAGDPEEAKRMGQRGRKAVEELYNWEKEGEKLLSFYEEILVGSFPKVRKESEKSKK